MGYVKVKAEFPCGMKFEAIVKGFGHPSYDKEELECPLHGKNCKLQYKRSKK